MASPHTPCEMCFGGISVSAHARVKRGGKIRGQVYTCTGSACPWPVPRRGYLSPSGGWTLGISCQGRLRGFCLGVTAGRAPGPTCASALTHRPSPALKSQGGTEGPQASPAAKLSQVASPQAPRARTELPASLSGGPTSRTSTSPRAGRKSPPVSSGASRTGAGSRLKPETPLAKGKSSPKAGVGRGVGLRVQGVARLCQSVVRCGCCAPWPGVLQQFAGSCPAPGLASSGCLSFCHLPHSTPAPHSLPSLPDCSFGVAQLYGHCSLPACPARPSC